MDINLIPKGSAPKSSSIQTASNLKMIAVIGTIILLFAIGVIVALYIINSSTLKASLAKQEQLKSQIKSLQTEETKYVLVKDRATKIGEIWTNKSIDKEIQGIKSLYSSLPPDVFITDADIAKGKTETDLQIINSRSLPQLFATIVTTGTYSGVVMTDFSFDPETGYRTGFLLTN